MKKLRAKIDQYMEEIAYWVYDRPWKMLTLIGLILIVSIGFLPSMKIDVTTEGNFQKADEALNRYIDFKKQFGSDTSVVIAANPAKIFDPEFLSTLRDLHNELEEEVPYLDEVTSLINIVAIRGENGGLVIEDLLENWPETEEELTRTKEYVYNHPDYVNNIISEKGDYTLIQVKADAFLEEGESDFEEEEEPEIKPESFLTSLMNKIHGKGTQNQPTDTDTHVKTELTNAQNNEIVNKVNAIVAKYQSDKFPLFVTGGPVIEKLHVEVIGATVRKTLGISALCIVFLLFFIFRRLSGVIIPLLIVALSLTATFGVMAMFGIPIRVTSQAFPPIVLAAGICDAVHLFSLFYQKLKLTQDKRQSIAYAMQHSGLAMFFTTLTTAGGFLSFAFADLKGIAEMGISAAIGVVFALVFTFLLVPSMI
ncbi:MAG: MMPL family transporter, partial [Proteobacteria bacterium]|nr:MMPL family transporter [Pseudomonadota bacterium]